MKCAICEKQLDVSMGIHVVPLTEPNGEYESSWLFCDGCWEVYNNTLE